MSSFSKLKLIEIEILMHKTKKKNENKSGVLNMNMMKDEKKVFFDAIN